MCSASEGISLDPQNVEVFIGMLWSGAIPVQKYPLAKSYPFSKIGR
jgi:hypothetical protein